MNQLVDTFLPIAGFLIGLGTTMVAILTWVGHSSQKRYAAERDFQEIQRTLSDINKAMGVLIEGQRKVDYFERVLDHTKNSMKTLSTNSATLADGIEHEISDLKAETKEMKAFVLSFSQRLDSILVRLESNSGMFGRRDPNG